jgi:menaquinone-dependent protoporphyrinogen IX oxidase
MKSNRTLIAYATKGGVTGENAHTIASVLREKHGFEVDVVDIVKSRVPDLVPFQNIFIGSGIRMGMWYRKAARLLKHDFEGKRVVLFLSACSAGDPESYDNAIMKYLKNVLEKHPNIKPFAYEAFGGRMKMAGQITDNTDKDKVVQWADEVGGKLRAAGS